MAKPFIIAEVGSNWKRDDLGTSREVALEHIRVAARCGTDAVKFQLFRQNSLYSQERAPEQYESVGNFHLPLDWLPDLRAEATGAGIELWMTPFAPELVDELYGFLDGLKIASMDITYLSLLERVGRAATAWNLPVAFSTGGARTEEIKGAIETLRKLGVPKIIAMYCISNYPAKIADYDLSVFPYSDLADHRGVSDHTAGLGLVNLGVELGYSFFEVHFRTDDTSSILPDFGVSLRPNELKFYVEQAKKTYNYFWRSEFEKRPDEGERFWMGRGPDGLRPIKSGR